MFRRESNFSILSLQFSSINKIVVVLMKNMFRYYSVKIRKYIFFYYDYFSNEKSINIHAFGCNAKNQPHCDFFARENNLVHTLIRFLSISFY